MLFDLLCNIIFCTRWLLTLAARSKHGSSPSTPTDSDLGIQAWALLIFKQTQVFLKCSQDGEHWAGPPRGLPCPKLSLAPSHSAGGQIGVWQEKGNRNPETTNSSVTQKRGLKLWETLLSEPGSPRVAVSARLLPPHPAHAPEAPLGRASFEVLTKPVGVKHYEPRDTLVKCVTPKVMLCTQ